MSPLSGILSRNWLYSDVLKMVEDKRQIQQQLLVQTTTTTTTVVIIIMTTITGTTTILHLSLFLPKLSIKHMICRVVPMTMMLSEREG